MPVFPSRIADSAGRSAARTVESDRECERCGRPGASRLGSGDHVVGTLAKTERIRVLQMVDTLDSGGMERVAVNVANSLRRDRFESALCTTRRDGALAGIVAPDVKRLR